MSSTPKTTVPPTDLEQLVRTGKETRTFDYKGPMAWDESDKKACCSLVKDILAMANSGGGHIVIGVAEVKPSWDFIGLDGKQAGSFDSSRLNRFVQNYADPPINSSTRVVEVGGKRFVVIEVPSFSDTPHICQKEYPGELTAPTLYVRSANNESTPIKSSADFRSIVEIAIEKRQDRLLSSFRTILRARDAVEPEADAEARYRKVLDEIRERSTEATLTSPPKGAPFEGYREAWAYPLSFAPDRFTISQIKAALDKVPQSDLGHWPFLPHLASGNQRPAATQHGYEAGYVFKDFADHDQKIYWYVDQSGLAYGRSLMEEEWHFLEPRQPTIETRTTLRYVADAVRSFVQVYETLLDETETVVFATRILGATGRRVFTFNAPMFGAYRSVIDVIEYHKARPLADWRAGMVDHVLDIAGHIFERFNWPTWDKGGAREVILSFYAGKII